jgi:hypothetical protein
MILVLTAFDDPANDGQENPNKYLNKYLNKY